ncbi:MAG: hypothetical protein R3F34_00885 [Planctomycetota bacterium]
MNTLQKLALAAAGAALVSLASCRSANTDESAAAAVVAYPTDTCIVTGEDLNGGGITKVYDGQEVKFCCPGCIAEFEAHKDQYLAKLRVRTSARARQRAPRCPRAR